MELPHFGELTALRIEYSSPERRPVVVGHAGKMAVDKENTSVREFNGTAFAGAGNRLTVGYDYPALQNFHFFSGLCGGKGE